MTTHGVGFLLSVLALGRPASAAYWWVSPSTGHDARSGAGPEEALRTLGEAVARAGDGDTIYAGSGVYAEDVRVDANDLFVAVADGAVFVPERTGLRVFGAGVVVEGGVWTGGDGGGAAVEVRAGGELTLRGVSVRDFAGTALLARGGTLTVVRGTVDGTEGPALFVKEGGRATVRDAVLRGFPDEAQPSALVMATDAGSTLWLEHSAVRGAPRTCVRAVAGATVELVSSVVAACGVESEVTSENVAVAAAEDARAVVRASQLMGQGSAPHSRVVQGPVELDADTIVNGALDLEGFAGRPAVLAITVDDSPNLDHALALAPVLEAHGGRLSFFANFPDLLDEAEVEALRGLVARGHEVGGHARTNGRLTQTVPLVLRWDGADPLPVAVDADGTTLTVGAGDAARRWTLGADGLRSLRALCAALSAVPDLSCTVVSTDPNALPTAADPTGLESGERVLVPGTDTDWPWDRRLPSAGGRHFRNELAAPRALLAARIGAEVRTLAYPGQQHDAVVRAAAADAGFFSARGASAHSTSDHRLWAPFDPFQAPMSLSVEGVKGPGYAALNKADQEARVRGFAEAWAAWAREVDAVGALTIHHEGTFSVEELGWLLDALGPAGGAHPTLGELREGWEAAGEPLDDGRWVGPGGPASDLRPGRRFAGRDRAAPGDRRADAAGRPIYGPPDIGPFEHQPAGRVGVDGLPRRGETVVYADGRFDGDPAGVPLWLEPATPATDAVRPRWATLAVERWDGNTRAVRVTGGAGGGCWTVGGLGAGQTWAWTTPAGAVVRVVADAEGRASWQAKGEPGLYRLVAGPAEAPLAAPCAGRRAPEGGGAVADGDGRPARPGAAGVGPAGACATGAGGPALGLTVGAALLLGGRRRRR